MFVYRNVYGTTYLNDFFTLVPEYRRLNRRENRNQSGFKHIKHFPLSLALGTYKHDGRVSDPCWPYQQYYLRVMLGFIRLGVHHTAFEQKYFLSFSISVCSSNTLYCPNFGKLTYADTMDCKSFGNFLYLQMADSFSI